LGSANGNLYLYGKKQTNTQITNINNKQTNMNTFFEDKKREYIHDYINQIYKKNPKK
jgi:hypothetical protein